MEKWLVRINDGPIQEFETRTGNYRDAAHAAYAILEFEKWVGVDIVSIVNPSILSIIPPSDRSWNHYAMGEDEFGRRVATTAIRKRDYAWKSPSSEAA